MVPWGWTTLALVFGVGAAIGGCTLSREGTLSAGAGGTVGTGGTTSSGTGGTTSGGTGGTTSSGTGGTTSSGTGGTTSSGTGGSPPENCLNGSDDDGDGQADCDDSDCQPDFECVAWNPEALGYLMVIPDQSSCPAGSTESNLSSCGCNCPPSNGTCGIEVSIDDTAGCTSPLATLSEGDCNNGPPNNSTRYFRLETLTDNQDASCSDGTTTTAPASDPVCTVDSPGSCSGGEVCVPVATGKVQSCIRVASNLSCPTDYPQPRRAFLGVPSGDCECTCSTNGTACEDPYTTVYHSPNGCTGSDTTVVPLTLGQCTSGIVDVDAHSIPFLASIPTCAADVTLPGANGIALCCS